MLNSIDNTIRPETDKEYKRQYTKHFVKAVDNNILIELLDTSLDDKNEYLDCVVISNDETKPFDSNLSYKNVVIAQTYEDSCMTKRVSRINENYFAPCEHSTHFVNPMYDFLKYTQGYRNIYFQNDYRGIYRYKYTLMYEDEKFKINCCDYLFTPTNGKINCVYERNTMDDNLFVNLNIFNEVRVYDYLKSLEERYEVKECKKTKFVGNPSVIQEKYKIVAIPKDIMKMFRRITADYKEALQYLKLNEKTGYYCYHYSDDISIPVICKHQIMLLQGVNPIDIANECYKDGICKFCKQDMIAYNQLEAAKLPPAASSLVISFAECFKESFSEESVIYIVFNFITKRLKKMGISLYSNDECSGYTSIYLLKLINLSRKVFKMNDFKLKVLIGKISSTLAFLGKSESDVKSMLENDEVFGDIESVITLLKSETVKYDTDEADDDILAEDVLFNSYSDRKPKNDLQKLYIQDKWKMYELFKLFETEYNKLYNRKFSKHDYNNKVYTILNSISKKINNIGYKFFQQMYRYYCPVNNIHEYKNGVCIHCSLHKDGKNVEEVYDKYSSVINNISTEEPRTLDIRDKKNESISIKQLYEKIMSIDEGNFLREHLHRHGIEYTDIAAIENNFKKFNESYMSELAIILNIDYNELVKIIPNDKLDAFIKKSFKYITEHTVVKEETIVNIVYVCYNNVYTSEFFYMI